MAIQTLNPATLEVAATFEEHSDAAIKEVIEKAGRAFQTLRKYSPSVRSKVLVKAAEELEKKKESLAALITLEMGKPIRQSRSEIEKCIWACNYYADNAKLYLRDETIETEYAKSYISYEPLGVILGVMPWNFPFWQVFRFAAPAIVAGNACILKHASNVPQCAKAIEKIFATASDVEGLFQNIFVHPDKMDAIISNDIIQGVSVTGSEAAGASVAESAGRAIKKTVMELGGSDAFIVLKDANLQEAAKTAIVSRMVNSGQSCIAAKRIIVDKSIAPSLIAILKKEIDGLVLGDPSEEATQVGPMAKEEAVKTLEKQLQSSVEAGAIIEAGGTRSKEKGLFFPPTLVSGVKPGMTLFEEEVFGPIMPIIEVEDCDEAVLLTNQSRYGLSAAIWTSNADLAMRTAGKLDVGNVTINGMVQSDPRLPFGGVKKSGYGRELSSYAIKEFVNIKTIVVAK